MSTPGLFGKLASQGDFVVRRLPPGFVQMWDTWLQEGMRAGYERHGADWLERYLHAPVWRFALSPGVCGVEGVAGVLLPSVDRVGRHFPLTLAQLCQPGAATSVLDLAAGGAAWFDTLAELGIKAMCGALSVAALDTALEQLGTVAVAVPAEAPGWVPLASSLGACAALARQLGPASLDLAAFWTEGAPGMPPALLLGRGMPSAVDLGDMLGAGA